MKLPVVFAISLLGIAGAISLAQSPNRDNIPPKKEPVCIWVEDCYLATNPNYCVYVKRCSNDK